ncbi:TPA: LysE family transporter [Providencia rettgeri]|uniref:LysE family transporter n=1 Tax=Providencia TaxID=586 RepID=UPI0005B4FE03|nr:MULTISPECIES: LysE family transporter [Providencia]EIU7555014.1 LysE family transporter [Providencia rettgeri]MCB4839542.1 LysE family transporter [Providencia rettgeri]MCG5277968.1 LysE family transporter [Providencia rettgeri]MCG9508987.1 LysE family transporter [Providencia rettgeri]HEM7507090.1 LysE family transporter [Providencia rettgeri]
MDPLHSIIITLFLFVLTFFNPGANLFIVVQTTLSSGKKAGLTCGYGVVLGNAIYSGLGLFGLVTLMSEFGSLFSLIKILGGLYLFYYAITVFKNRTQLNLSTENIVESFPSGVYFRRGVISDLSNPQTVLFFMSIFSTTILPSTPLWTKLVIWFGIIIASLIWRIILCQTFSMTSVRRMYSRIHKIVGKAVGIVLGTLASRLIYQGVTELVVKR